MQKKIFCFFINFFLLAIVSNDAIAESEIPVLIAQAQNSKVMFMLDDSNSMEAVMTHEDYDPDHSAVVNSNNKVPMFIFKVNSGNAAPLNSHSVTAALVTFQYGFCNIGKSWAGHVYYGNLFEDETLGNIDDHPVVASWVPTSNCCYVCLPNVSCSWSKIIGIANAQHFTNSSIKGSSVFSTGNFPTSGGSFITDSSGNEMIYVDMQRNDYVLNYNWGSYWPELDSNDQPIANHNRMFTTTGHTVKFNGKEVFLSAGLYEERYLRWIFYVATDEQLEELPGITRSQLVKDVMEMLILDNPNVQFGITTLNGSSLNAGVNSGYFSSQFFTPEGNNTFFTEPTVRAPIGTDASELVDTLDTIGATSGTPLQRTYVEVMRYFDGDSSNYSTDNVNYTSPIESECDTHFTVMLTDGLPTSDCRNYFRGNTISDVDNDGDSTTYNGSCSGNTDHSQYLDDAAKLANSTDFNTNVDGDQTIISYAVGLGLDFDLLNDFAINGGSGESLRANTAAELTETLQDIVATIIQTPVAGAGFALAETVGAETRVYRPTFFQNTWRGTIDMYQMDNGLLTFQLDMGELLEERDLSTNPRTIYAGIDADGDGQTNQMIDFSVNNVSTLKPLLFERFLGAEAENTALLADPLENVNSNTAANTLINYIHGIDAADLRVRDFDADGKTEKLGDIVYSQPIEVGPKNGIFDSLQGYTQFTSSLSSEPRLLVVGANDGMIHAFEANTGEELWAYIPSNLLKELEYLARPDYNSNWHRYYIDGQILVQDAYVNGSWRTLLAFGQRKGGSTYTVLDITDRNSPSLLFEVSHPEYLGESWARPAVVKNGGLASSANASDFTWYLAVGTGEEKSDAGTNLVFYHLDSSSPSPIVLSLEQSSPAGTRTSGTTWTNNDLDLNDDRGYVGTEAGDLYRIEVGNGSPSSWNVVRVYNSTEDYPITSAPATVLAENPQYFTGGTNAASIPYAVSIHFGTGRYDKNSDVAWSVDNPQRIIGLFDPTTVQADTFTYALSGITINDLQKQNSGSYANRNNADIIMLPLGEKGFYIDLGTEMELGSDDFLEPAGMVIHSPSVVRGAVLYSSFLPHPENCEIGGFSFLEVVDFRTGGGVIIDGISTSPPRPHYSGGILDYNDDTLLSENDITYGLEQGYIEVVMDTKVSAVNLEEGVDRYPYEHDGIVAADDVRLHDSNGGILPAVAFIGNAGAPSQPAVSIGDETLFFQNAFVGFEGEEDEEEDDDPENTTICHRPPGNPNNSHTISVGSSAVAAHLNHGDHLGPCEDDENEEEGDNDDDDDSDDNSDDDSDGDGDGDGNGDGNSGSTNAEAPGTKDFNVYTLVPEVISFHEYTD